MKILRIVGIMLASTILLVIIGFVVVHEPLPQGEEGLEADELARKMIESVEGDSWNRTGAVSWTFRNPHYHIWDRVGNYASVEWENRKVLIDIDMRKGVIKEGGENLSNEEKSKLCEQAWKFWVNDSFWLNPIVKAFDGGTSRSIVDYEGKDALLVTYSSGGATPGDSYLWILDESYRPIAWKMWVSIIPIGGLEFTWADWIETNTGAWVATTHEGLISVPITDVQTEVDLISLTSGVDIFDPLTNPSDRLISF